MRAHHWHCAKMRRVLLRSFCTRSVITYVRTHACPCRYCMVGTWSRTWYHSLSLSQTHILSLAGAPRRACVRRRGVGGGEKVDRIPGLSGSLPPKPCVGMSSARDPPSRGHTATDNCTAAATLPLRRSDAPPTPDAAARHSPARRPIWTTAFNDGSRSVSLSLAHARAYIICTCTFWSNNAIVVDLI